MKKEKNYLEGVIEKLAKQSAESDRELRKEMAEINKEIRHIISDLSKEIKGVNSKVNGIGYSNGKLTEVFFEEATEDGITLKINDEETFFEQTRVNLVVIDHLGNPKAEIDLFLTNGSYVLLVESKYSLDEKQLWDLDHKIKMLKEYLPKAVEGKEILTAFASCRAKKEVKEIFTKNGHFVFTENNRKIQTDYPVL